MTYSMLSSSSVFARRPADEMLNHQGGNIVRTAPYMWSPTRCRLFRKVRVLSWPQWHCRLPKANLAHRRSFREESGEPRPAHAGCTDIGGRRRPEDQGEV